MILPNYEIILNVVEVTYVTLIERCQKGKRRRSTLPMLAVLWRVRSFRKSVKVPFARVVKYGKYPANR